MNNLLDNFGIKVFNDKKMKEKLPSPVYKRYQEALNKGEALDRITADAIAHAMKEWALSLNCTHFTHWFQPLTGSTAEKHDAFLDIKDGEPILKFSGKNLIKGEPDASSFPNGGLRATFEARGYTYWDCTSPAFIRDNILCIPTIFVSFTGEALDMKEPLLKSMDALSAQAVKIVNAFGNKEVSNVYPSVGLEQEYFLIDKDTFLKRTDLVLTNHTILGAMPPKGQELSTHYLGPIPERVKHFMSDVNKELWELGIYAKNEHNEVAPSQFELASIFTNANIAIDQNNIIMDVLTRCALKHNLVCILHEKPYKGVNGSGKHNNWSLITNSGINLLDPGKNPHDNVQFLVFVSALIEAVDKYPEIIRLACANSGNDYRLGANEAPPAIVSMYLGQTIEDVLSSLINDKPDTYEKSSLKTFGISNLSYIPQDNSDRNRTSPVAFTGNKFEFRMLGSSMNAAHLNIVINTIVADSLKEIADKLEKCKYRQDIRKEALDICIDIVKKHNRIIFSGDGYSSSWVKQANKRGLANIKTFVESISAFEDEKAIALFKRHNIFTEQELSSRVVVLYENYAKNKNIEARTLLDMIRTECIPCVCSQIENISKISSPSLNTLKDKLMNFIDEAFDLCEQVEQKLEQIKTLPTYKEKGFALLSDIVPLMDCLREKYDSIEKYIAKDLLPYPSYLDLLYGIDY